MLKKFNEFYDPMFGIGDLEQPEINTCPECEQEECKCEDNIEGTCQECGCNCEGTICPECQDQIDGWIDNPATDTQFEGMKTFEEFSEVDEIEESDLDASAEYFDNLKKKCPE
jgi:hypothetical protein